MKILKNFKKNDVSDEHTILLFSTQRKKNLYKERHKKQYKQTIKKHFEETENKIRRKNTNIFFF